MDDMRFIQDAVAESLKGVLDGLTYFSPRDHYDGNVVLSGSVTSGKTSDSNTYYDVSEGYVSINHEVYPIKPGRIVVPERTNVYWVVKTEVYQNETQANNTEVMVYERKFVQLSETYEKGEEHMQYSGKMLIDHLMENVKNYMNMLDVSESLNPTITGPMAGKCRYGLQYNVSNSNVRSVSLLFDTGSSTTYELEAVNNKRRLMTYKSVRFLSLTADFVFYRNGSFLTPAGIFRANIIDGNVYISDTSGNPTTSFPSAGSFSLDIIF